MAIQLLAKLKKLNDWQVALTIIIVGLAVFFTGFNNPFQGDDETQIVNNIVVHSVSHIDVLFNGSTFYNGGSATTPLLGTYYRPLMMVVFSFIYTIFGANPLFFHLFQILIFIVSAILLYLIFRCLLGKKLLALALALIFLVHPISSQVAFAIPSMQDALFFFFGALALWFLMKYESTKSLWLVALFLLLSLFSKETGVFFVLICLLYLIFYKRERIGQFVKIISLPVILWLILKVHAVGLFGTNPHIAPINQLDLFGRLMNVPSIILFYIERCVFPWQLATQYHWAYITFSVQHVLLPLLIDLIVLGLVILTGRIIKRRASKTQYHTFLFFAVWAALGLTVYLQIIPLDMTVCENWFYFSMAGVLGMIGVALMVFKPRLKPIWLLTIAVLLIAILGVRTAIRGTDYSSSYKLSLQDVAVSKEDFKAYTGLSQSYFNVGDYSQAKTYAQKSIDIFPDVSNYQNLGAAMVFQGDYVGAYEAYNNGLKYGNYSQLVDNLAQLTLVHGTPTDNQRFFAVSLKQYPNDPYLWSYYALLFYRAGNVPYAKAAISYALTNGQSLPLVDGVYSAIAHGSPITIIVGTKKILIP
jgi:4-amino-4-deoxy-L-arabinose transferase-like glycosyltransferase